MGEKSGHTSVTVIVPVHNPGVELRMLVDALLKQAYPQGMYTVVVVDDGSSNNGLDGLAFSPRVRVVKQKNAGSYTARNTGVKASQGEILAFTDGDCLPEAQWLEQGVQALEAHGADIAAGRIVVTSKGAGNFCEIYDANFNLRQDHYARRLKFGATANLFVRRELLERVGGFDCTLRSGGDHEFCKRAIAAGADFIYAEDAVIHHPARATFGELKTKLVRVSRGRLAMNPSLSYLLPRLRSSYPKDYDIDLVRKMPLHKKIPFNCLYYYLDFIRILAYCRGMFECAVMRIKK